MSSSVALIIGGYLAIISNNINFLIVIFGFVTALIPIFMMKETPRKKVKLPLNLYKLMNF